MADEEGRQRRVNLVDLAVLYAVALAVRAWPLARFAFWGSDTGEYLGLTNRLVTTGHILFTYHGWGIAYPYFPGLYVVAGAEAAVLGVSVGTAIRWTGPALGALVPVLVALLADRVMRDRWPSLAAGGLAATAMPLAFVTSHTLLATPGYVLAAGALLLLLLGGEHLTRHRGPDWPGLADWWRLAWPHVTLLALVGVALVVTHHLTLYFLVGAVAGGVLLRELGRPRSHAATVALEGGFVVGLVTLALVWWLGVAVPFRDRIVEGSLHVPLVLVVVLAYAALALVPALVLLARRDRPRWLDHLVHGGGPPGPDRYALVVAAATVLLLGITGFIVRTGRPVPGTSIVVSPLGWLYVVPLCLAVALAVPGLRALGLRRHGSFVWGWLLAYVGSLLLALATDSHVILPYRHADALVLPVAILLGGSVMLLRDHLPRGAPRVALAGGIALLLAANAAAVYPPTAAMGGFQEGITAAEVHGVQWAGLNLPANATVASDHRLSSFLFGLGGLNATWDSAGAGLHDPRWNASDWRAVDTPSGPKRIDYVMISPTMEKGVALYQWDTATPMSAAAIAKFHQAPFKVVYDVDGVVISRIQWNATAAG